MNGDINRHGQYPKMKIMKLIGKNGLTETNMDNKETWKAIDLYHIAVSDKGRIMVEGQIMEPSQPNSSNKRYHYKFRNPLTGRIIKRDAATLIWRTFKGKVDNNIRITFKDGDMSNLNLENLQWEYIKAPIKKHNLTDEQMRARVPLIIEKMVKKWGCKDMQEPLTDVKS